MKATNGGAGVNRGGRLDSGNGTDSDGGVAVFSAKYKVKEGGKEDGKPLL